MAAPRRRSLARSVAALAALVAVLFVASYAIDLAWTRVDAWRHPWGYPAPGRKTLVGTWVGPLVTGGGKRLGLLVDLQMVPAVVPSRRHGTRVRREREGKLQAAVRLCPAPGIVQRFSAHGDTQDDARASRFHLGLSVADPAPRDGLAPSHLRGRWDGADTIAFEADVHLRKGVSAISATDDPDTGPRASAQMRRGGEAEFQALCSSLGR